MIPYDSTQNSVNPNQSYDYLTEQSTLDSVKSVTEKKMANMDLTNLFWKHSIVRYKLYGVTDDLNKLKDKLSRIEKKLETANGNKRYVEEVKENFVKKQKDLLHIENKIKNKLVRYEDEIAKRYNAGLITHEELEIESGYTSDEITFYYGGRLPSLMSNIQNKIIKKERSRGDFLISNRNLSFQIK